MKAIQFLYHGHRLIGYADAMQCVQEAIKDKDGNTIATRVKISQPLILYQDDKKTDK